MRASFNLLNGCLLKTKVQFLSHGVSKPSLLPGVDAGTE